MKPRVVFTIVLGIVCIVIGTQSRGWIPADSPYRERILATTDELKEVGVLSLAILLGTLLVLGEGVKEALGPGINKGVADLAEPIKAGMVNAMGLAERSGNPADDAQRKLIAKMKNSLAYYFAEAGDRSKRDLAFRYIYEARDTVPNASEFVDTLGCVQIAFGTTKDEINAGIGACFRSAAVDHDYAHFHLWLDKAIERMKTI